MKIGVINEPNDQRVALGPDIAKLLVDAGIVVSIESGAGLSTFFQDSDYRDKGVEVLNSAKDVLSDSDVIVSIRPVPEELWSTLKAGVTLVSCFQPYVDSSIKDKLEAKSITTFSMDMIPRTTLAQSMDVLSSMASIAGYQAVLEAAQHLPKYFPMLSTAAGTVPPAKALVLGAGVAGLQAIATAKRLGAKVEAFDTRVVVKEEVESLGAKFVEVEGAVDDKSGGGYGVEQTEQYKQQQRALIAEKVKDADVVITTAQVRGPKAPILISKEMVESMKPGSVIMDLAASTGGNCEMTKDNQTVMHHNVAIIGDSNLPSKVSLNATQLFGKNVFNFLKLLIKDGKFDPDWDNVIVKESCIVRPDTANS